MHVGAAVIFQSHGSDLPDHQIYANDLSLVDLVEPLGYESIWSVEHHFTDYTMCPDVYQFLSYCAGRTKTAQLGSMVLVLPWHDLPARPKKSRCSTTYRVAASSSVLDGVRVRSSSMASVSTWAKAESALSKPRKPSWRAGDRERWRSPEILQPTQDGHPAQTFQELSGSHICSRGLTRVLPHHGGTRSVF